MISPALTTDLLILPDGRILVHNMTRPFAELLSQLNPEDEQIEPRARERHQQPSPATPSAARATAP